MRKETKSVRVPAALHAKLIKLSEETDIEIGALFARAIKTFLEVEAPVILQSFGTKKPSGI